MTKGKYGLCLSMVAVLAFVFAGFGMTTLVVAVLAFAVLCEKNEWLTKQCLQGLYLLLLCKVIIWAVEAVFGFFISFFSMFNLSAALVSAFVKPEDIIVTIIQVAFVVLVIYGAIRLAMGKDAGIPLASALADKTLGIQTIKQYVQPTYSQPQQVPQQPVQPQAPQQAPAQQPQPAQPPVQQAAAGETWVCPHCGKVNNMPFCQECGTKKE